MCYPYDSRTQPLGKILSTEGLWRDDLTGHGHPRQVGRKVFKDHYSSTSLCSTFIWAPHIKNWRCILPHMCKSVLDRCDNLHLTNKDMVDNFHKDNYIHSTSSVYFIKINFVKKKSFLISFLKGQLISKTPNKYNKVPLFFWFDLCLETRAEILTKICSCFD